MTYLSILIKFIESQKCATTLNFIHQKLEHCLKNAEFMDDQPIHQKLIKSEKDEQDDLSKKRQLDLQSFFLQLDRLTETQINKLISVVLSNLVNLHKNNTRAKLRPNARVQFIQNSSLCSGKISSSFNLRKTRSSVIPIKSFVNGKETEQKIDANNILIPEIPEMLSEQRTYEHDLPVYRVKMDQFLREYIFSQICSSLQEWMSQGNLDLFVYQYSYFKIIYVLLYQFAQFQNDYLVLHELSLIIRSIVELYSKPEYNITIVTNFLLFWKPENLSFALCKDSLATFKNDFKQFVKTVLQQNVNNIPLSEVYFLNVFPTSMDLSLLCSIVVNEKHRTVFMLEATLRQLVFFLNRIFNRRENKQFFSFVQDGLNAYNCDDFGSQKLADLVSSNKQLWLYKKKDCDVSLINSVLDDFKNNLESSQISTMNQVIKLYSRVVDPSPFIISLSSLISSHALDVQQTVLVENILLFVNYHQSIYLHLYPPHLREIVRKITILLTCTDHFQFLEFKTPNFLTTLQTDFIHSPHQIYLVHFLLIFYKKMKLMQMENTELRSKNMVKFLQPVMYFIPDIHKLLSVNVFEITPEQQLFLKTVTNSLCKFSNISQVLSFSRKFGMFVPWAQKNELIECACSLHPFSRYLTLNELDRIYEFDDSPNKCDCKVEKYLPIMPHNWKMLFYSNETS